MLAIVCRSMLCGALPIVFHVFGKIGEKMERMCRNLVKWKIVKLNEALKLEFEANN